MDPHNHSSHDHSRSEGHYDHSGGHHDHHIHMIQDFKWRFYINTALSMPVLLKSIGMIPVIFHRDL